MHSAPSSEPAATTPVRYTQEDLCLVRKIAHHMILKLPQHVCLDDLIQAGTVGLIEAYHQYDPNKGASFGTYASIRIRGAIIDEMRKGDWAPRSVHRNSRLVTQKILEIESRQGTPASRAELASALQITLADLDKMLRDYYCTKVLSYDDIGACEELFYEDLFQCSVNPLDLAESSEKKQILEELLGALPDKEERILRLYFHEQQNLKSIAAQMGVSESRVSQIMSAGVARLKSAISCLKGS